jgi:hypothetical protein
MVEHLIEVIQRPKILHDRLHPEKPAKATKPSKNLLNFLNRLLTRRWIDVVQDQLMEAIVYLRQEVKFIEHLPRCYLCKMTLELDVERYLGNHSTWYLSLENSEYLEKRYPSCPRERNYQIGNYWEQLQHFRKYGNTDTGDNTVEFILARAKWAYKIMGKQIRLARRLLCLVRAWDFTEERTIEFQRLYERLGMYEIVFPFN